jgi:hypothetical protein
LLGFAHLALYRGAVELGLSVLPKARHQGIASAMFCSACACPRASW